MKNKTSEMISVPVNAFKDALAFADAEGNYDLAAKLRAYSPCEIPKPRLVAVDPDQHADDGEHTYMDNAWLDTQPDLLTLLDDAVGDGGYVHASNVRRHIREALGVTDG